MVSASLLNRMIFGFGLRRDQLWMAFSWITPA
jgi:hypothetical protein